MNATITPLLDRLFSLHRFGIRPGLERISTIVAMLGNPQESYPVIHVAGTNGKGSVCSMLAAILASAGYRVGLYTSPHIRRFNERIRVNGAEISDADIARIVSPLLAESEKEHTTFFEITTAAAFSYFAEQSTDIAIIETGMGGRLDATNILNPLASVITSIDFDHAEYLGNTLELIAAEKAGIIKPHTPVIVGESCPKLVHVFERIAKQNQTDITPASNKYKAIPLEFRHDFSMSVRIEAPNAILDNVQCGLAGHAQTQNITTVMAALDAIADTFPTSEANVRNGLKETKKLTGLSGRIELLRKNPPLVIDVGHNPACIRNLMQTLKDCGYADVKWQIVFGAMADKDISDMLALLHNITDTLIAVAPNYNRALFAKELANRASSARFQHVIAADSVADGIALALQTGKPTLIAGSFYVADEALQFLENKNIL